MNLVENLECKYMYAEFQVGSHDFHWDMFANVSCSLINKDKDILLCGGGRI